MKSRPPIVYVEDRQEDVFLVQFAFQKAEIQNPLRVAEDGEQAVDYLSGTGDFADRQQFPRPCLILLDLKLPRKTGLEVLQWIRQQSSLKSLVVIILSSSMHDSDIRNAYQLGVNAFLVKPPDLSVLTDMCRALKHFWLTYNEPPIESVEDC